jgi:hypothetical protein
VPVTKTGKVALYSAGGLAAIVGGYVGYQKLRPAQVTAAPGTTPGTSGGAPSSTASATPTASTTGRAPGPSGGSPSTGSATPTATASATPSTTTTSGAPVTAPVSVPSNPNGGALPGAEGSGYYTLGGFVSSGSIVTRGNAYAPGVPLSIEAAAAAFYAAQQSAEIAAAEQSYTGNRSTPGPTNPFIEPTPPSGDVETWLPGTGWEAVASGNDYLAQVPAALQQGLGSWTPGDVPPGIGTPAGSGFAGQTALEDIKLQAQYDADVAGRPYVVWEIPASENAGQAMYYAFPSGHLPTQTDQHWTDAVALSTALPSAIPSTTDILATRPVPPGTGGPQNPTLSSTPSSLLADVSAYVTQDPLTEPPGYPSGVTIPAGTGIPAGSGNVGLDSWQLAQLAQQAEEQAHPGVPYVILTTAGQAAVDNVNEYGYLVVPASSLDDPNAPRGWTVTAAGTPVSYIGQTSGAATSAVAAQASATTTEAIQGAQAATTAIIAHTPVPSSGYTGYLHVALPSGNFTDVYVAHGQYDGVTLPVQPGGTMIAGTYWPPGSASAAALKVVAVGTGGSAPGPSGGPVYLPGGNPGGPWQVNGQTVASVPATFTGQALSIPTGILVAFQNGQFLGRLT